MPYTRVSRRFYVISNSQTVFILMCLMMFVSGCPKARNSALTYAKKAENAQDFDLATEEYQRASRAHPNDAQLRIKLAATRTEAGQRHFEMGQRFLDRGLLDEAASELRRASSLDPSNQAAQQALATALAALNARTKATKPSPPEEVPISALYANRPPELKVLTRAPINLRMANDARVIYETIAKLAGISVIFDADFPSRRITVELNNVSLEDALDLVSIESKAFWKPASENVICIIPDQQQKRRDYDEQVIQTFYLSNSVQPQDLTEIVTGLRQLLDLKRVHQLNSQNAIIIRDTPGKVAMAKMLIDNADRARPEVLLQVEVLQARTDLIRKLGVNPGTSISISPNTCANSTSSSCSSSSSTSTTSFTLNDLKHLGTKDYNITLPTASATALMNDTYTQIIQNPEIRSVDGQPAKLRVGDRVPVATGSYQTGATATTTSVSALVSTQYQYIDVGVSVDVTPHIHPNREVSLKVAIEVSSVTGYSTIGSLQEPIISQRKIEHEIRLKEGEVSVLGGLFEHTYTKSRAGLPGVSKIPLLSAMTSEKDTEGQENEILIVLSPRIVRLQEVNPENLRAVYTGSESNFQLKPLPGDEPRNAYGRSPTRGTEGNALKSESKSSGALASSQDKKARPSALLFEPGSLNLRVGETATLKLDARQVNDLYSIPILFQYDPKVIGVEDVRHGEFFSGGGAEIAVAQQINIDSGIATISAARPVRESGVSGSGTILEIKIRGLKVGSSEFNISAVHARNSQQADIEFVMTDGSIVHVVE